MSTTEAVAAEARAALARRSMTQAQLAEATGKSRPYWQSRLAGKRAMTLDDLAAVADATATTVAALIGDAA